MELSVWTYEGPPHVGAMRVATAMKGVHFLLHAPQGDTYADLLFTMIERRKERPPVTYTTSNPRYAAMSSYEIGGAAVTRLGFLGVSRQALADAELELSFEYRIATNRFGNAISAAFAITWSMQSRTTSAPSTSVAALSTDANSSMARTWHAGLIARIRSAMASTFALPYSSPSAWI